MNRAKYLTKPLPFQGLHPPFTQRGKMLIVPDEVAQIRHSDFLLRVALSDCTSENPFQDLGTLDRLIFQRMTEGAADLREALEEIFQRFTDRFDTTGIQVEQNNDSGVATANAIVRYTPFNAKTTLTDLGPVSGGNL